MVFLFGLGLVYGIAYACVNNVLVLWPLLIPIGSFFNNLHVYGLADQPDRELAEPPALADTGVETAASRRGLAPTMRSASACSMPAIVGLNR